MPIPRVTHLQFLILDSLASASRSGRELRATLAEHGARSSLPAFYQLMARLEEDGLVTGWYEFRSVEDRCWKERHYEITDAGRREREVVRDFYRTALARRLTRAVLTV
jgi:DNA-binding PadR family transcriptional regulator